MGVIPDRLHPMGRANWRNGRPYDAEVEYIESNGTQVIDTGFIPVPGMGMTLVFEVTTNAPNRKYVFGSVANWSSDRFCLFHQNYDGKYGFYASMSSGTIAADCPQGSKLQFVLNEDGRVTFAGTEKTLDISTINCTLPLALFGRRDSAVKYYDYFPGLRIYACTITYQSAVVCDFVPVRIGQSGAMYDRISGQLHTNAGTGTFGVGSDIGWGTYDARVEYLDSDGTAWIDTGIIPQLDDEVELEVVKPTTGGNSAFGCAGSAWRVNAFALLFWQFWLGNKATSSIVNPNGPATFRIANRTLYRNGTQVVAFPDATGDPMRTAFLFALHDYNATPTYKYTGAISRYKHSRNGVVLRDMFAVRVGQTGYMYDKVSGRLFGSIGTGAFLYGDDKP